MKKQVIFIFYFKIFISLLSMVININAIYKEFIHKFSKNSNYVKIRLAVNGELEPGTLTDKEKRQLISIIDDGVKQAKENILKS